MTTNQDILSLFADSVNAYRDGNPEEIAAINAVWDSVVPTPPYDPWMDVDGDEGAPRDLTDGEYDRIANAYERRLGL